MSDKSIRSGFGLFSGRKADNKADTTVEQRCAAGLHAVDPLWTKCWYCEATVKQDAATQMPPQVSGAERGRTVMSEPPAPARDLSPAGAKRSTLLDRDDGPVAAAGSGRGRTVAVPELQTPLPSARNRTMVDSGPAEASSTQRAASGGRRLVGVLTTFTWSGLGSLHEIRDGRNHVGSGGATSRGEAPEIVIGQDSLLSGSHFMILCQGPKIIISDNFSTNGTFVNGEQIDTRGMDLADDAVIKAGGTVFRFQRIHTISE